MILPKQPLVIEGVASLLLSSRFFVTMSATSQDAIITIKETAPMITEKDLLAAIAETQDRYSQAETKRQEIYNALATPVQALIGISLVDLTAPQLREIQLLEMYIGKKVSVSPIGQVAGIPAVTDAPIVYPVTVEFDLKDGVWYYGIDNLSAWQAFVGGVNGQINLRR